MCKETKTSFVTLARLKQAGFHNKTLIGLQKAATEKLLLESVKEERDGSPNMPPEGPAVKVSASPCYVTSEVMHSSRLRVRPVARWTSHHGPT